MDFFDKDAVFFLCPRTFFHFWVEHFLPTVEALDVGPISEALSNLLPITRLR